MNLKWQKVSRLGWLACVAILPLASCGQGGRMPGHPPTSPQAISAPPSARSSPLPTLSTGGYTWPMLQPGQCVAAPPSVAATPFASLMANPKGWVYALPLCGPGGDYWSQGGFCFTNISDQPLITPHSYNLAVGRVYQQNCYTAMAAGGPINLGGQLTQPPSNAPLGPTYPGSSYYFAKLDSQLIKVYPKVKVGLIPGGSPVLEATVAGFDYWIYSGNASFNCTTIEEKSVHLTNLQCAAAEMEAVLKTVDGKPLVPISKSGSISIHQPSNIGNDAYSTTSAWWTYDGQTYAYPYYTFDMIGGPSKAFPLLQSVRQLP